MKSIDNRDFDDLIGVITELRFMKEANTVDKFGSAKETSFLDRIPRDLERLYLRELQSCAVLLWL